MFPKTNPLSMKRPIQLWVCGILILLLETAAAQGPGYISVGDFTGTANERINAAIAAAMATNHKTVFFPNGTYALRSGLQLNQGTNTELHLIGESRDGVLVIPDIPYLTANYNGGAGARLAHMVNLDATAVFASVDVSIENMTIDMRHPLLIGVPQTYNVVGHGLRIGRGWTTGQFTANQVTIRNVEGYGVGIQDRGGHPKNNITLTDLNIERCGSDGIDTKEASGDGNRILVIRDVSVNEIGFFDTGAANAIDVRYRDAIIERVNLVSLASRSTLPGQTSTNTGINFRPFESGALGIVGATVADVYLRGFSTAITVSSTSETPHQNIAIRDFKIHRQSNAGIGITGTNHSGHTISNGYVDPAFGGAAVSTGGYATVSNVTAGRWDPALSPVTDTTFESNVSLAGKTFSPAWVGIIGSERVRLNPASSSAGPFVFDVGSNGVMRIDYDGAFNAMDRLIVDGTLNLDGELRINTIGGAPTNAGTYRIFEADAITGAFDTISLPPVPGMMWVTDNLATDGTIRLQQVPNTIIPVNTGSRVVLGPLGNSSTSFPFNAGADADMLMVAVSSERSTQTIPTLSYGGLALSPAIEKGSASIWYLDLTKTDYQGGAADLVIDFTGINPVNGVAMGAVSVRASGRAIEVHSTDFGTESANLVTTRAPAFILASFNANGSGSPSVDAPLTTIYASGNIGSAQGAAGYNVVDAGTHPINWTTGSKRMVAAAAFVIANNFANWIADYEVGGAIGLGDDSDGDGLPNGVEAIFGTHPAESSGGLGNLASDGTTTTFTHPQSTNPPADLSLFYQWSPNLTDWYDCDGISGPNNGAIAIGVIATNTLGTTKTVTLQSNGPMDRLFLRAEVEQRPSPWSQ
jgi:Pectate lyase superfamily protein